jgi:hypothetical protein
MAYSFENQKGGLTREAAGTIGRYERIKIDTAGKWVQAGAGAGGKAEAVAEDDAVAGDQLKGIPLIPATVVPMKAAVAITQGALVYGGASGKINVTNTNCLEGKALEAASGDNSIIPVMVMNTSAITL